MNFSKIKIYNPNQFQKNSLKYTDQPSIKNTKLTNMNPEHIVSAGTNYTPKQWRKLSIKYKNGIKHVRIDTKNLKKTPAIYYLVNMVTGRFYVGESGVLRSRILGHNSAIRNNKQCKQQLYRDINMESEKFQFGYTIVQRDKSPRKIEKKVVSALKDRNKNLYNLVSGGGGRPPKRFVKKEANSGGIEKARKNLNQIFQKMK